MFDSTTVILVVSLYMGGLVLIAQWVERRPERTRALSRNSVIYSLALAVYCTTWTFYGNVGSAATSGFLFMAICLGCTLSVGLWWTVLRKLVRIKTAHRITSIADFISARYNRSQSLAALVTVMAVVGIAPYIALQFRAIESTFSMIVGTGQEAGSWLGSVGGPLAAVIMVLFTIVLGIRRLDPTERHPGMMTALAVESLVKLVALLAVGIFVTYFMYDGLGDIFNRLPANITPTVPKSGQAGGVSSLKWTAYLLLAMSTVLFLPRQFHVAVVENVDEKHIKMAMWLFPLYLFLIHSLIYPIAMGGLLQGYPVEQADTFVLALPLNSGRGWLSLFVFLGGFSAATAMIMVSSITMATMITNHLLLPVIGWFKWLGFLRRQLLPCRWLSAAGFIALGYWFQQHLGHPNMLVNVGTISFVAMFQFGPPIIGGIFWRRANKAGALLGLTSGFAIWGYTLLLPAFVRSGWFSSGILDPGPWGVAWLNPERLFGVVSLDPVTHAVFWCIFVNLVFFVGGSFLFPQNEEERSRAEEFVAILGPGTTLRPTKMRDPNIRLEDKRLLMTDLLSQYFPSGRAKEITDQCISSLGLEQKEWISIIELAELQAEAEKILTGSIGAAQAHRALKKTAIFSFSEERDLSDVYGEILADLKVTPDELKRKVDYYMERERLVRRHAADLEEKIKEREEEIRQRKLAEEKLKKAEEKYRNIFENAVEGIYQTTPDGRFVSANRALAEMLGYGSPEELIEKVVDIRKQLYVNAEDRDELLDRLARDGTVSGFECRTLRKDGSTMWASINARMVYDDSGQLLYVEGIFQDISDRKRAEEERAALEAQLLQSQKMEAIGRLAGGVAHDFNNLLTAMLGYSNVLMKEAPENSPQREKLAQINRAAERAAALTHQLLAFSRKQVLDVKVTDLNELIQDLEKMLRRLIGEDIDLVTHFAGDLWRVQADPGQIQQIVMNLVVNARDAMPNGGTLSIETNNIVIDEDYARLHGGMETGPHVMFSVSDTGVGIDEETLNYIFDPFFTTKSKELGTGLGLSTVYGIVKQHKGHVSVHSERGVGTRFEVFLPAVTAPCHETHGAHGGRTSPEGRETILVVEDEEIVLRFVCEGLEMLGYTTIRASDPEQALDAVSRFKEEIHLLLTDVVLPRMDGRSLFNRLSSFRPRMKVLYMSGYAEDYIVHQGVLDPGVRFLQKPFTIDKLAIRVRETLDEEQAECQ